MARSKPTKETIEKVTAAVLEQAKANKKLPELLAAILTKMREADPDAADAEVERLIDLIAELDAGGEAQKVSSGVASVRAAELRGTLWAM